MAFTRVAALLHAALSDVVATQHHTATVAADLDLADLNTRAHANLSDAPADAHHDQAHDLASHSTEAHAELTSVGVDDHHDQSHTLASHSNGANVAKIVTGSYTGDGATSQVISVANVGQIKQVRIWVRVTATANIADGDHEESIDVMVDDVTAGLAAQYASSGQWTFDDNGIIALGSGSFTVDDDGSDGDPNTDMVVYNFVVVAVP